MNNRKRQRRGKKKIGRKEKNGRASREGLRACRAGRLKIRGGHTKRKEDGVMLVDGNDGRREGRRKRGACVHAGWW